MKSEKYIETIKCDDYKVYNLEYHKKRMANSVGKNFALEEYIYPPNEKLLKCKVIYDENEIIDISYDTYKQRQINSFKIIKDDNIVYNKKSTNRDDINYLFSKKELANDIIILKNGLITDTSIANIAIWFNDSWITPKIPLLLGTTRARYIDENIIKEENITLDMLNNTTKIALLNAMVDFNILDNFDII
ncbi:MAG: aminotransferase class IV [Arcobacteraceae bacterium]|nr:aminotransferase class IV [Arcobacteraceae bacterium]